MRADMADFQEKLDAIPECDDRDSFTRADRLADVLKENCDDCTEWLKSYVNWEELAADELNAGKIVTICDVEYLRD